jgi:hypothetical protein
MKNAVINDIRNQKNVEISSSSDFVQTEKP